MGQNSVIFKGKNDGILIILDDKIAFEELRQDFEEKVSKSSTFFRGANISVAFKGRVLSDSEEMELLDIISKVSELNISFVHSEDENPVFVKQKKLSKFNNINISKDSISKRFVSAYENITSFHKGSVRNGQSVKFKGSIVIIGDVNPGGEVISEGNVIVLGSVKGLIHAGCGGRHDCFIIAFNLKPTQLRIADIVTYFPEKEKTNKVIPECAFAKNGEIYVEPLMNL